MTKWVGDDTTTAVMDTSRTIRNVRRSGIPLMGIYVGGTGRGLGEEKIDVRKRLCLHRQ